MTTSIARKLAAAAVCMSTLIPAGILVFGTGSASASTEPSGPYGSQFCSDYGEGSNGSYANVYACNGPYAGDITFRASNGATITTDTVGFQCVELAARYLYAQKGWGVEFADGADIARVYGGAHGVSPVVSGNSSGATPQPGDVISFSVESNFTDDNGYYPGHVALVVAKTSSSITILSENWENGAAEATLSLSGTRVQAIQTEDAGGGLVTTPYVEWLPISASSPTSYGPYQVYGTGSNGLNERSQPTTSSTVLGNLPNGSTVYVTCQAAGSTYSTDGGSPASEDVWDRLTNGDYVADYWVATPAAEGQFSSGIPRC